MIHDGNHQESQFKCIQCKDKRDNSFSQRITLSQNKKELQVVSIVSLVSYSCLIPIETNVCLVINVYQSVSYRKRHANNERISCRYRYRGRDNIHWKQRRRQVTSTEEGSQLEYKTRKKSRETHSS